MGQISPQYIAGFFDGEGCVHAHKNLKHIGVFLTQRNPEVLTLVSEVYGGRVRFNRRTKCCQWVCPGKSRERFLKDILPYVISKKEQVELALTWEMAKEKSMVRDPNKPVEYSENLQSRKDRRVEKERIRLALIDAKTKQYGHLRGNYSAPN